MTPKLKWILIGLGVVVIGAQAIRPDRTNPPYDESATITAQIDVPSDVAALLERSCTDCHSHRTEWPWYSNVAPASWLVARHASHGRDYLNFDRWADASPYERQDAFDEIARVVGNGEMPLPMYLPLHPEAKLSDAERERLVQWAESERDRVREEIRGTTDEEGDEPGS